MLYRVNKNVYAEASLNFHRHAGVPPFLTRKSLSNHRFCSKSTILREFGLLKLTILGGPWTPCLYDDVFVMPQGLAALHHGSLVCGHVVEPHLKKTAGDGKLSIFFHDDP